mgnify:CR=1 FL=1
MKRPSRMIFLLSLLLVGLGCSAFLIRRHQAETATPVPPPSKRAADSQDNAAINDWQRGIKLDRRPSYTPTPPSDRKPRSSQGSDPLHTKPREEPN